MGIFTRKPKTVAKIAGLNVGSGIGLMPSSDWAHETYGHYIVTSLPAYRAVTLRASAVASARLMVGNVTEVDGVTDFVPLGDEDPTQDLLDRVNKTYTRADLWYATETYLMLYGSAFWYLVGQGENLEIWPLHPDKVNVIAQYDPSGLFPIGQTFEVHTTKNTTVKLKEDEVVWFRKFNPLDEFGGLSPIAPVRLSLDMGRDALRFNRAFFKNNASPGEIALTYPSPLTDPEVEAFYKRWDERFKGPDKAHRPILLQGQGVDAKNLGISQKDMEFLAALNWTVEDAARAWGVPPPLMYSQASSIYNNVSEANRDFWRSTVMSEWQWLEAQLTEHLLPRLNVEGVEVRFDYSDILPLQESMAEINKEDREDVKANILTINEVREKRGLAPVDWGDEPTQATDLFGLPPDQLAPPATSPTKGIPYIDVFGRELRRLETTFARTLAVLFQEQRDDTTKKVSEGIPPPMAFNEAMWTESFSKRAFPLYERALTLSAAQAASRFNLFSRTNKQVEIPRIPVFTIADPAIRQWLETRVRLWATLVNEETGRLINQEIIEASANGESIRQVQDRLEKVFRFNDAIRTERIARTEMLSAANKGHLSAYEQSGVVDRIKWVATADERTRPTHAQADGQVVELGQPFHVGNALLDAPGVGHAGMAPAEEVINCRCTSVPVFERRGSRIERPDKQAIYRASAIGGHARNGH